MDIQIRPASAEDAGFIAWVMINSGQSGKATGFWDALIPESLEEQTAFARLMSVANSPSLCHYSGFAIAEHNNKPVGGLCGYYTEEINREDFRAALKEVMDHLDWSPERREAAGKRLMVFFDGFPGLMENAWVVEWVAVEPEYRRRGIMTQLIQWMLNKGFDTTDCDLAQIAVLIGNEPAIGTYLKAGFEHFDEKRADAFEQAFGSPGMYRLTIKRSS